MGDDKQKPEDDKSTERGGTDKKPGSDKPGPAQGSEQQGGRSGQSDR